MQVSTYGNMDEAVAKLRAGQVAFDVLFPTYDYLGKLVQGNFLRPLNHSYVPNIEQVWPAFQNPWYDQGWNYSVPYTIYTTGIAWRVDKVTDDIAKLPNPYEALWDERYRGKVGILDDYREGIGMTLLKNGVTDLNTGNQDHLNLARDDWSPWPRRSAAGQHQRLHRPARGQDLDHPGLVGRHGQRPVLHAQGTERRRDALLVP